MNETDSTVKRRRFLRHASAGLAGLGAMAGGSALQAQSTSSGPSGFQPARHDEDAWLDQVPGRHRLFLDSVSADGFGAALLYSNNFFNANRSGYGLEPKDLAIVIGARHASTPFAYSDAMWAKYGEPLSRAAEFTDPKTQAPATINVFQASGYGGDLTSMGTTVGSLVEKGLHFAVCQLATRRAASIVARATNQQADAVYAELTANLVGNAHMVPAGIVALARAQEHGYAFAFAG